MDVSYRQIAKVLAEGMLVEGQDYSDIIDSYIKSIEAMPVEQQSALKASYIFSRKVSREERQDLFQHLIAHILKLMATYPKSIWGGEDAWCYVVARHEWKRITRERKRHNRMLNGGFISLNEPVKGSESLETELQELLAGKLEWTAIRPTNLESEVSSKLDNQTLLDTLPDRVKAVIVKRLEGQTVSHLDYKVARRYILKNGDSIRKALKA